VDLTRLAGLSPVGVIGELVHDDGTMMRFDAVVGLGREFGLPVITIEQLVDHRQRLDRVERLATTRIPTVHGTFTAHGYRDTLTGDEHVALVSPRGLQGLRHAGPVLTRLHSECLTGDAFGSLRCDCGPQLQAALTRVGSEGGVVVYLGGHEGRGVGLVDKLRAYSQQDRGADTVDAQTALGLPVDAREYAAGAAILHDLGATEVVLLTNNPNKVTALRHLGVDVVAVERLHGPMGEDNEQYLMTKRERMGHDIPVTSDRHGGKETA
jgi:3,4-dihydroxy 2-butanone 4-phosphate synthase/GTP cyclohydrolase II